MTEHPYQPWLGRAFDQTAAEHASAAMAFHRDGREREGLVTRSYEVVLPDPLPPLRDFLEALGAKLEAHLEALGLPRTGHLGVFLSVFAGDRLYFVDSSVTLAVRDDLKRGDKPVALLPG